MLAYFPSKLCVLMSKQLIIAEANLVERRPVHNQRLGVSGLALHYANIINQIDNIVST